MDVAPYTRMMATGPLSVSRLSLNFGWCVFFASLTSSTLHEEQTAAGPLGFGSVTETQSRLLALNLDSTASATNAIFESNPAPTPIRWRWPRRGR
jgi:hypothetical protein